MAFSGFSPQSVGQDDAKNKADKRRFENDLMMMQGERSTAQKNIDAAELDIRVLQKKYTALGFEIKDKQAAVKTSQGKLQFLDEEIRILKKKIANL
jgi:peptidoglycan hydrolase CwlO-like protein